MPMLDEATKTLKGGVRARPLAEGRSDGGIELWAIGRQEVQAEVAGHFSPPRCVQLGVMVTGIVADEDDLPAGVAAQTLQFAQEGPASLRVKHPFGSRH